MEIFSGCYQKMRERDFFKFVRVRNAKKNSLQYAKIEKHCCIATYSAASTVGGLSAKPVMVHFKSLLKIFDLEFWY